MSDKKLELSRRRVLAGLGTIGVASAGAGAGTMALFSDRESSDGNVVKAGTLDLLVDGGNSNTELLNASDVAPGFSEQSRVTLRNDGTVDGTLGIGVGRVVDNENGMTEPESDVDATGRGTGFALDFDSLAGPDGSWKSDRTAPAAWGTATKDGESALRVGLDSAEPDSGFYNEQGKKYLADDHEEGYWKTGIGSRLTWRFYLDPSWEDESQNHDFGVWAQLGDGNDTIVNYSVLHYVNSAASDHGGPGFKLFHGGDDYPSEDRWEWLGLPSDVSATEGGFVDVSATLVGSGADAELVWRANGTQIGSDASSPSTGTIQLPILNHRNFGDDASYYHSVLRLDERCGELAESLELKAHFDDASDTPLVSTYEPLEDAVQTIENHGGYDLDAESEVDLVVDWRLPTTVGNEVQSDEISVDFEFALDQN